MIVLALALLVPPAGRTLYVSPGGDDARDGRTPKKAFATINRAAAAARPGDTCSVLPGTYRETVTPPVNGTPERRIVFRAATPGTVTITGADPIVGFVPVAGETYRAPMRWSFSEKFQSDDVFSKGQRLELLRWPKNDRGPLAPADAHVVEAKDAGGDRISFRVSPPFDEPDGRWAGARVWVNLSHLGKNWGQDGQAQTGRVVSTDRKSGTIIVSGIEKRSWEGGVYDPDKPWGVGEGTEIHLFDPTPSGLQATGGPQEALGPDEWWRDGEAGALYVRTRRGRPTGVEARRRAWAFNLDRRRYVTVEGFNLFATSITTDDAAEKRTDSVADSEGVVLRNLRARYLTHFTDHSGNFQMQWLQKSGIRLSGRRQLLERCLLEDSDGPAVSVIGIGNRVLGNTIRRANVSVSEAGCLDTGRAYDPKPTTSLDHEIGYNTIEDSPQQGMNLRGLVNSDIARPGLARVHHNVIRRVMTRSYDSAALDQFGTDGRGVRIDHNVISDLVGSLRIGIYVDFGQGYVINHNLITNVERPIQINHKDPAQEGRVYLDNNTCVSTGPPVQTYRMAGILNGAGDHNPKSAARRNLSSLGVRLGVDTVLEGNVASEADSFVDAAKGDFRPAKDLGAGAFEYGKPAWRAGAAAYLAAASRPKTKSKRR